MWAVNNFWTFALLVAESLASIDLAVILDALVSQRFTSFAVKRNSLWAVDFCWALALLVAKALASIDLTVILDASIAERYTPFAV